MTPSTCEGRWDLPVKYGYQSVGRVIDAGRSSGYGEGDLVFCRYPHQDVYTIDATDPELVYRIPEFDPPEIGVLGNNADVALTALLDVPVRLGDVVVVAGLGHRRHVLRAARASHGGHARRRRPVRVPARHRAEARRRRRGAPRRRGRRGAWRPATAAAPT